MKRILKWMFSGMLHHVVWQMLINISEELTASMSLPSQKTYIYLLVAVRTLDLTKGYSFA
jgi:hypothetical protein